MYLTIGNGESRKHVNLNDINIPKVGCNAIYRDYSVEQIVCCDRRMVKEAYDNSNIDLIYTRSGWYREFPQDRVFELPDLPYQGDRRADDPFHWGSGPYSVLVASLFSDTVLLLGHDLYGNKKYINNIYKETRNYKSSDSRAVDPSYWIYQIGKLFEHFSDKHFIILQDNNWIMPDAWNQPNVSLDSISRIMYYNKQVD